MDSVFQDVKFAMRQLLKQPGFTIVAAMTLALGIGANTAMFSIINATVIEPLPYSEPDRLVRVREVTPEGMNFSASEPNYLDFRDQSKSFTTLAAFKDRAASLVGTGEPVRLDGLSVTHDFFTVLGADAAVGRTLLAGEDVPGADSRVVVLDYRLWQQRFNGAADIVGQKIVLDGSAYLVVGVMPADFNFLDVEFYSPLAPDARADRGDHWLGMIGKLQPGVSVEQAGAELKAIAERIGEQYPSIAGWSVRMEPLSSWLVGKQFRQTAWLLFGAVGFLLLMACVNLANLLFVRGQLRQGEIGVRAAMGARRSRILRQLLTETLLLSLLGTAIGVLLAWLSIGLLQQLGPENIPRLEEIRIDGRVLGFTLAVGLLTAAIFGVVPGVRASRVDLSETLQQSARGGGSREQRRLRDGLVIVQIALATLLLAGAGLLLKSFWQLQSADPGFDPEPVLAVQLQLGDDGYREPWQKVAFYRNLIERVEALPGVAAAGATATDPFSGGSFMNDVTPVERAAQTGSSGFAQVAWRAVTPGFFHALQLPLHRGRLFTDEDPGNGPRIVVITSSMAERLWPDENAVGKELYWGGTSGTPRTVIGVVGDYQDVEPGGGAAEVMFIPHNQLAWGQMTLLVRTGGEIAGITRALRNAIAELDPALPVPAIRPMQQKISAAVAGPRFRTALLGAFALAALLLAAVGIYGVMAYNVSQRTREMGLRLAMGAQPHRLLAMVMLRGTRLVVIGAIVGVLCAFMLARYLQNLLYETAATDVVALTGAVALLALVALAAIWLPARRAARIQPMQALRDE